MGAVVRGARLCWFAPQRGYHAHGWRGWHQPVYGACCVAWVMATSRRSDASLWRLCPI